MNVFKSDKCECYFDDEPPMTYETNIKGKIYTYANSIRERTYKSKYNAELNELKSIDLCPKCTKEIVLSIFN